MVLPLLGGVLIGLAIATLLLLGDRIAGISGILDGLLGPDAGERAWRAFFVAGLIGGGLVTCAVAPAAIEASDVSLPVLAVAGVLVGVGTRMAGGCTSGHGVCGISRLAPRSLVATGTFMTVAALVVFAVRHGAGQ
jgi:uncharacterized protein